ncbi:hypothetical protein BDA99DRAFT_524279 [Phascolomyces articulosus]|uniref:Uncharacterized protein n=1 Tax=Phascolomyces articulosus TaxID=60185 RepID=A0AAD5K135_9FUNG|nr:hypothetical protein BDA99DRAFT_524279 [Phascolomyces articulosus]
MDLSWCIVCDNRIDSNLNESDLYCSDDCKVKDSSLSTSITSASSSSTALFGTSPSKRFNNSKSLLRNKQQRPTAPSTSYPWIPLYRRRPVVSRRPMVPATSTSSLMLCRKPSTSASLYRPNVTAV